MSLSKLRIMVMTLVLVAGLSLGDGPNGTVLAGQKAASPSRSDRSLSNEVLLSAASPFEDLTENALAGNKEGIQLALKAYEEQAATVNKVLSPKASHDMELLVAAIKKAEQHADHWSVARNAVEAYRTLIESLDIRRLKVPIQVALLDYAGFKLKVLLQAKPLNWSDLRKTTEEAGRNWSAIASRVSYKGLRDAVDTMITGLNKAITAKNAEMALFAAQIDLALVDLLEGYFEPTQNKVFR